MPRNSGFSRRAVAQRPGSGWTHTAVEAIIGQLPGSRQPPPTIAGTMCAMTDSPPRRVLISNDDGFDAPGLAALYAALSGLADVSVVAPARGVSSAGHGITDRRPIRVDRRDVEPFGTIHVVDALPADCARLALAELLVR